MSPRLRTRLMVFSTSSCCFCPRAEVGSSRISTRAPKKIARAMARVCFCPPDIVPTACSGLAMLMPILAISSRVMRFISAVCMIPKGRAPLVSSRPMKKLRVTEVSALRARSW